MNAGVMNDVPSAAVESAPEQLEQGEHRLFDRFHLTKALREELVGGVEERRLDAFEGRVEAESEGSRRTVGEFVHLELHREKRGSHE